MSKSTTAKACESMAEILEYHARVAKQPIYMTLGKLRTIMEKVWDIDFPYAKITRHFPSDTQWGHYAKNNGKIITKKERLSYIDENGLTRKSPQYSTLYAYGGVE